MKKSVIAIIIAVLALGALGYVVFANTDDNDQPEDTVTTTNNDSATAPETTQPGNGSQTGGDNSNATQTDEVEIEDFAFSPNNITVKVGTTVTWTNKDNEQHDITPDNPTDAFKKSELLSRDESYSVTFTTPGTYTYHCSPHPYMTGTVTVTE